MTEFEKQVLEGLTELRTEMRTLVGNGQPGRVQILEKRVEQHERFVQRAGGLGAALAVLLTLIHLAFDYLHTM
jgi:hypothetical protein